MGRDKLYAVKNIENFLVNVEKRQTESYGKYLTLDHGIEQFDGRSQELIHLLMNEFNRFRTVGDRAHWWNVDPFRREKNKIALTGDAFDRLFDLWEGKCLETSAGDTVGCFREDPEVGMYRDGYYIGAGRENSGREEVMVLQFRDGEVIRVEFEDAG